MMNAKTAAKTGNKSAVSKTTTQAAAPQPAAAKPVLPNPEVAKPAKGKGGAATKVPAVTATAAAPSQPVPKPAAPSAPAKKLGCLDAAAKVLAETNAPMSSKELIAAMAAQKLWSSPAGQTPHATLYSAIGREIRAKGKESRFVKADKGKFAANTTVGAK